ncbi:hypothetical protein OROGR_030393 [Orobanche gracilis]
MLPMGMFVDQLNTYIETSFADTTVVALFSVKIKEFQGKITLQNTMHSTKMVFNPQFPEAIELRGCVSRLTSSGMPCLVDDFLTLTEAKTIAQLMELTDDIDKEMGLWTLLEGSLLLANALAILNEDRFLAPRGWSFQEYSGVTRNSFKGQILGLIYATQYLRVPLILLNLLCIVVKVVSG